MNSLSTLASLFLIQARRFIKFVKQVFQQQQTSSSELWNRWHLIDRSTVSTKKGVAVEKYEMKTLSNESQKGVPPYVRTSFLPLLPSIPVHFCWHAITVPKEIKIRPGYLCVRTLWFDLGCSSPCGSLQENKAGIATQKMCRWVKKNWLEIRNAEQTVLQVD